MRKNIKYARRNELDRRLDFLGRVGATLEGIKPAEILTVTQEELNMAKECLKDDININIVTVKKIGRRRQVFVYHKKCLENCLSKKGARWFLSLQGYGENDSVQVCVERLTRRLRSCSFPHEIGVFLGYPLKDVFGFMGLNSLKHTKTKGWRMYGDTSKSESVYYRYNTARAQSWQKLLLAN